MFSGTPIKIHMCHGQNMRKLPLLGWAIPMRRDSHAHCEDFHGTPNDGGMTISHTLWQ